MRRFNLIRNEDETGISGIGIVAEGIRFSNGQVCLCWRTIVSSVGMYRSIADVEYIHGHGGKTVIQWLDTEDLYAE